MLLRLVPVLAVVLTLLAVLSSSFWRPHHNDGLYAPAHSAATLF